MKKASILWISILISLSFSSTSSTQSRTIDGGAHLAKVQGRFEGSVVLSDLPKAVPLADELTKLEHIEHENETEAFQTERVGLQPASFRDATALSEPQVSVPPALPQASSAQSGTISPLLTFLPPNTVDQSECGGLLVPDGAMAASPTYLVEVSNFCLMVLNPNTGAVISGPTPLQTFFSTSEMSDERVLYDPVSARFFMTGEDHNRNLIFLAVTQSSNPTLGWYKYSFSAAGTCNPGYGDFPTMGQTLQEPGDSLGAIYLAWNIACPPTGLQVFVGAISKTVAYAGETISSIEGFQGLTAAGVHVDSVQPVSVMNAGDHPRSEFLINSFDQYSGGGNCANGCKGVVVWSFYNGIPASGGAQSLTSVVVPTANTYYLPVNAPEPGCAVNSCGPNAGPPIISGQTTYSAGSIFAALNDSKGILVLELEPFVNNLGGVTGALMRNEICFACAGFSNGGSAYYGTVQPDSERNFVMSYTYSAPGTAGCTPNASTCIYPSSAYVSRRVTQAQNTFADQGLIFNLGGAYYHQLNSGGVNRWGDYSGTAPVYGKSNSFWVEAEYAMSNGQWGKAVAQTAFTSPAGP